MGRKNKNSASPPPLKVLENPEEIKVDINNLYSEISKIRGVIVNLDHVKLTNIDSKIDTVREHVLTLHQRVSAASADIEVVKSDVSKIKSGIEEIKELLKNRS